jgi:hypothetical protein
MCEHYAARADNGSQLPAAWRIGCPRTPQWPAHCGLSRSPPFALAVTSTFSWTIGDVRLGPGRRRAGRLAVGLHRERAAACPDWDAGFGRLAVNW